ncbi:AAA family ATPase [Microbacterium marinilacus]|uniref:ATP-binding protein n=1 Tax=Microbacterium marinilacus TaxID=415209 RepID=A0ABP7BM40_9MICO|nr:ATP-binding protein [Microbacterium marinilacus]MBY0688429.1 ATP-binding protein [Microbacterium marinilacus]
MALVLMCGLSFSGKSTLAALLAAELPAEVLSLDRINQERGFDGGQGIAAGEWSTTNKMAHERAIEALESGAHVIVDDTGSPRFVRDAWRDIATAAGVPFTIVWVQVSLDLQRQRVQADRETRGRPDVTDAVLAEHAAHFEAPSDESPLIVDASHTADPVTVEYLAAAIETEREGTQAIAEDG